MLTTRIRQIKRCRGFINHKKISVIVWRRRIQSIHIISKKGKIGREHEIKQDNQWRWKGEVGKWDTIQFQGIDETGYHKGGGSGGARSPRLEYKRYQK